MTGGGRRSVRDADAAARRASVCAELPEVHDALGGGRMSAGHVDAVARLAGELDDAARAELQDLQSAVVQSASGDARRDVRTGDEQVGSGPVA